MDEQANAYWTYGVDSMKRDGILAEGTSIDKIVFNFLNKSMRDKRNTDASGRALNKDGTVSKVQPAKRFHREPVYRFDNCRPQVMGRAIAHLKELQQARAGNVAILKAADKFTCKFCSYRDVCELHETGQDFGMLLRHSYSQWDPYDAHVIVEEERQ
jgi:hypothetical protein